MKKTILLIAIGAALGGGAVWIKYHHWGADSDDAKPAAAAEEADATRITHDTNGRVVINMSDDTQGDIGIKVANPETGSFSPEMRGYGRVQDPAPLAALISELATDRAACAASSNEFARLKILAGQSNASTRALQAAEAAALHDQLAMQSARERLVLSWGKALADREDLPAFLQSLTSQEAALVRVDLPAGQAPSAPPVGARLVTLSGGSTDAQFLGEAAGVDPQTQGRGFLFLVKPNSAGLVPGQALTAFLKLPGEPVAGVIIPRNAVVRTEGRGWVYLGGGEALTRTPIAFDHPVDNGWFVSQGVLAGDYVVVEGAQVLLSEEMKASFKAD